MAFIVFSKLGSLHCNLSLEYFYRPKKNAEPIKQPLPVLPPPALGNRKPTFSLSGLSRSGPSAVTEIVQYEVFCNLPAMREGSNFFTSSPTLICFFKYCSHFSGYDMVCHGSDSHLPHDRCGWALFYVLLALCISSLAKCSNPLLNF